MPATIRQATPAHATAIASIKRAVWPGEALEESQIAAAIADSRHRTHLACVDARVVGFVDSFSTADAHSQPRWEVDLLAVHPDFHGQKIGQQLITASTQHARQQGVPLARALIQIDNRASQGAFQRCGYHSDGAIYTLMVADGGPAQDGDMPPQAHLVPVNTMNYRGLWLEGDLSSESLAAAQAECLRRSDDLAGALIPAERDDLQAAAMALGYATISRFRWWICRL